MKTVLILSWWLDSTTLLYRLISEWKEVLAISFDYGQRHKKELDYAAKTCAKLGIPHQVVDLSSITGLINNSCLTGEVSVTDGEYYEESMKLTVVPNRNSILANIAIAYAINIEADEISLWVHSGDHHIYPDCRPLFIEALRDLAQVCDYRRIGVYTPYLQADKRDILLDGVKFWVDYGSTWTCYKGSELACWVCGSCNERLAAFKEAGLSDPLRYENSK